MTGNGSYFCRSDAHDGRVDHGSGGSDSHQQSASIATRAALQRTAEDLRGQPRGRLHGLRPRVPRLPCPEAAPQHPRAGHNQVSEQEGNRVRQEVVFSLVILFNGEPAMPFCNPET